MATVTDNSNPATAQEKSNSAFTVADLLRVNLRKLLTDLSDTFLKHVNDTDTDNAREIFLRIEDVAKRLNEADDKFFRAYENLDVDEEIRLKVEQELVAVEEFRNMYINCKSQFEKLVSAVRSTPSTSSISGFRGIDSASATNVVFQDSPVKKRSFKLPKIELKTFDGDLRNWIAFWSQFRKIDEDETLPEEDKFHYLIQCMQVESPAKTLVETFPPSKENYPKVIQKLKERFARENVLIEVYVRDLLQLVLESYSQKETSLTDLSDKLETKLKALESLGVTSDKYASMLSPLVESCLPTEILQIWERHRTIKESGEGANFNHLASLLDFIKSEVAGEQRVLLARNTFSIQNISNPFNARKRKFSQIDSVPTVSTLAVVNKSESKDVCIFCSKDHLSADCFKAIKLTLDERKDVVKKSKVCFKCLKKGHSAKKCKKFVQCIVCKKAHYAILCPNLKNETDDSATNAVCKTNNCLASNLKGQIIYLPTLIVRVVEAKGEKFYARVLLDSASQNSYIVDSTALQLGLPFLGKQKIKIGLFGGVKTDEHQANVFNITLEGLFSQETLSVRLLGQNIISEHIPKVTDKRILKELESKGIKLSDLQFKKKNIDILLGADILSKVWTGNKIDVSDNLIAQGTKFGWAISGYFSQDCSLPTSSTLMSVSLVAVLSDFWSLENIGVTDDSQRPKDLEVAIVKNFYDTLQQTDDGRYVVELPWIDGKDSLACCRFLAERRLEVVTKRLIDLKLFEKYEGVFKEWQNLGMIESVPDDKKLEGCFYLPHHEVIRESSNTTKIRPVFDASAKQKGFLSLNDCLAKGPNLLETVPPLLIKFRLNRIAFTADIEKAFLQIALAEKEKDYVRFIWWENYEQKKFKIYRHCRVVFGVKPSPFLLNCTILHHLSSDKFPDTMKNTASELLQSFYVDNCVNSVDDLAKYEKFKVEAIDILRCAQFNLREWVHSFDDVESSKVLGIFWKPRLDLIFYKFELTEENRFTKRTLLSLLHKFYDPLGLISPFLLVPKIIFQESCKRKVAWDDYLPAELNERISNWLDNYKQLTELNISRWVFECSSSDWTLHVFCDASAKAYATCLYVRGTNQTPSDQVSLRLLMAKTRVAPLKTLTIPRLELMAALIAVRLVQSIKHSLPIDSSKILYWSDSSTVLQWLAKENIADVFVRNRIKEIKSFTNINQWRFVPGDLNPADIASRGSLINDLVNSTWFNGPDWLRLPAECWPVNEFVKGDATNLVETQALVSVRNPATGIENPVLKSFFHFYSDYDKILRVVGWFLRFINNCRSSEGAKNHNELISNELNAAEIFLIKLVQSDFFSENPDSLKNFDYFVDEQGLIRIRTRLLLSDNDDDFKTPILLPKDCIFTRRLLEKEHRNLLHTGINTIITNLRQRFWVISCRKLLREITFKCIFCRRFKAPHGSAPVPPLPKERYDFGYAFQNSGIDLCGPLTLINGATVYVALFTCAVVRAVHLEIVFSLSTDSFILAFRRFIARRGRVENIITDNGRNFVGAKNLLSSVNWAEIAKDPILRKINWKMIPPSSPWWGGFWERLIRVVKELIFRNLGRRSLYFEELHTLICEIEAIINQRPLSFVSDDASELSPLRPVDFIQDFPNSETPDLDQIDSASICQRKKYVQKLRDGLRSRFNTEYLSLLISRSKGKKFNSLSEGQVVLIGDDNQKRFKWPLGKILKLFKGIDGECRVALLKTKNGQLLRSINRLYPLEVD